MNRKPYFFYWFLCFVIKSCGFYDDKRTLKKRSKREERKGRGNCKRESRETLHQTHCTCFSLSLLKVLFANMGLDGLLDCRNGPLFLYRSIGERGSNTFKKKKIHSNTLKKKNTLKIIKNIEILLIISLNQLKKLIFKLINLFYCLTQVLN